MQCLYFAVYGGDVINSLNPTIVLIHYMIKEYDSMMIRAEHLSADTPELIRPLRWFLTLLAVHAFFSVNVLHYSMEFIFHCKYATKKSYEAK